MTSKAKKAENVSSENLDHFAWLVKSRERNQDTSLRLLRLFRSQSRKWGDTGNVLGQMLLGIAFSLWRAVFLADFSKDDSISHADSFLEKMIADNAISYPQDKGARAWTFGYYMTSARLHLAELARVFPEVDPKQRKSESANERWDHLQDCFEKAVLLFEKQLKTQRVKRKKAKKS